MSKPERVKAALAREEVDRAPVSAWWHDFPREFTARGLAEATLEAYRTYGWDFVKVNPRASYYGEAWGAKYGQNQDRQPTLIEPGISAPEHLKKIRRVDISKGVFAREIDSLVLINKGLKKEAPFIQTVFSPLATMSRITGSTKYTLRLMRENPDDLLAALDKIADTLGKFSAASVDAGASGIFYATVEWGSADLLSYEDYERFARPFDLKVLKAVRKAPFNVLHVCRNNNHLLRLLDYPVGAFNWAAHGAGNPDFATVAARGVSVMGGVSHDRTMPNGGPVDVVKEARASLLQTRNRGHFLTPECAVEPTVPPTNLRALVQAAVP
jgi:uroporphyrinogen decarboxylase